MFKQQEMNYMWNSQHAYDGGAFNRQLGRWTERSVPKNKNGDLWNHYHPGKEKISARKPIWIFERFCCFSQFGILQKLYLYSGGAL